MKWALGFQ
jgi:hypothetical protein